MVRRSKKKSKAITSATLSESQITQREAKQEGRDEASASSNNQVPASVAPLSPPPPASCKKRSSCIICFDDKNTADDPLIRPCMCQADVHRWCLEKWRHSGVHASTYDRCPTCRGNYVLEFNLKADVIGNIGSNICAPVLTVLPIALMVLYFIFYSSSSLNDDAPVPLLSVGTFSFPSKQGQDHGDSLGESSIAEQMFAFAWSHFSPWWSDICQNYPNAAWCASIATHTLAAFPLVYYFINAFTRFVI